MFNIRLATPGDLTTILDMIDEAAGWLRTRDTDQWSRPWPNLAERDTRVLRGLLACRTWLVLDGDIPVATVTSRPDGNQDLWNQAELQEPAAYISRLVVSRKYSGTRTGAALIDWAGAQARAETGAGLIRIDVWTTNTALHAYYERLEFYFLRFCEDSSYPSAALFYKRIARIPESALSWFWPIPALSAAPCTSDRPRQPGTTDSRQPGIPHTVRARHRATSPGEAPARSRMTRMTLSSRRKAGHSRVRARVSHGRPGKVARSVTVAFVVLISLGSIFG